MENLPHLIAVGFLEYEQAQAKTRQLATLKQGDAPVQADPPERESKGQSRDKAGERMGVGGRNVDHPPLGAFSLYRAETGNRHHPVALTLSHKNAQNHDLRV